MTLDKTNELMARRIDFGRGYHRNTVKMVLADVNHGFDQTASDHLIRECID